MNALQKLYYRGWRMGVLGASLALIAYLLYFHRLGSLLPGYSSVELKSFADASNWHAIADNPVNAPYKIIVWFLTAVLRQNILMTRVVAASFGTLAVFLFFGVIRRWYEFRVAFFGTILFATSAGFLHAARFGTGLILQMAVLDFISLVMLYCRYRDRRIFIGYFLAVLFAVSCYVPGLIWFELLAIVLFWQTIRGQIRKTPNIHLASWSVLFIGIVAPLGLAAINNSQIAVAASGLPQSVHALTQFGSNLLDTLMSIGVRSNGSPLYWVGHAPLLNVVELVLFAIGIYASMYRTRTPRANFWAGCIGVSIVLVSFGGGVGFAMLVPLLYLFIVAGVDFLLGQWMRVFPRNPIARYVGTALIIAMLFFSVLYQVRSYFVAWPNAAATKQAFRLQPPN